MPGQSEIERQSDGAGKRSLVKNIQQCSCQTDYTIKVFYVRMTLSFVGHHPKAYYMVF